MDPSKNMARVEVRIDLSACNQPLLSLCYRHGCSPSPPLARGAEGHCWLSHFPLPDASARGCRSAGRFNEPPWQSHDAGLLPWAQLPLQVVGIIPPGRAEHRLLDRGAEDLGGRWDTTFISGTRKFIVWKEVKNKKINKITMGSKSVSVIFRLQRWFHLHRSDTGFPSWS